MDFPTLATLQKRCTSKWTTYGPDVLPLWIAESDFPTAPPVLAAIKDMVAKECFGYNPAPGATTLRESVASFYGRRYGWTPDPARVFWIPDVVRGLSLSIQYFTRAGSAVAVPTPSYPPLLELPGLHGRERLECGLDLESIERAFAAGAGSILLANPYNPLGTVLDREMLTGLVDLAVKYDARILADEIHAPLVFDGRHLPVASLSDAAADRTITVTATSKAFNTAGLKCAQLILSNEADYRVWKGLPLVAKEGTGTMGILAAAAAYDHGDPYLDQQLEILRANRDFVCAQLPSRIPGIKVEPPQATYLAWLDFNSAEAGIGSYPAAWLLKHARVALNEGASFGTGGAGHARLNFATSREILEEAIDRMAGAVERNL
ncbi:aminotransferase [Corynebacterium phocae]|uniref:cysteine-S-conjugate beta-lyase n=1 Tax=Corynebacterium phocae TaxID=161895 RepID=A0A1L7D248_9CORY|nr:aminotransferase class I/II-fold pyridoxal phosphate-dependent enzyme [Corynebacterium phocae]APT92102.1 aminotransferase [Corynebacterium phocae]KAA8726486.1 aminotransferase class I/II-fold pyridoxal phosphate-dependent enzyme [Corynebacterium phocae]